MNTQPAANIAMRHRSDSCTNQQFFQSLEKLAAKSSNHWKLFLSALILFSISLADVAQAQWFQVRNAGGSATPGHPAGTIYVGDSGLTFSCDAWGTLNGAWGGAQVYIHTGSDIHNGTAGAATSFSSGDAKSNTSGKFTSSGTWYWGIRMQYNTGGTIVGWYNRNNSNWADAWGTPTSDLTVSVTAIPNPSGLSAGSATSSSLTLNWTKNTPGHNVMIVRSSDASFTAPSANTSYSVSDTIGGDTVIYNGSGTSTTSSGLSSSTTYYYRFYSVNGNYYSSGADANGTTSAGTSAPTVTSPTGVSVETTTATLGATVSADGGAAISDYGIVWGTSANPTTSNNKIQKETSVTAPNTFTVSATGLSAGTTIHYRGYAVNSVGTSYSTGGTILTKPAAPTASAASSPGLGGFTANWFSSTGASGYALDVARDSGFTSLVVNNQNVGNVSSYAVSGLSVGEYYYRVRATNATGASANSSTINAKTTTAQTRNAAGGSPSVSPGTIYVGDYVTFTMESWGTINGNYGKARLWTSSSSTLTAGSAGSWGDFVNTDTKAVTSQFTTAAATVYWGVQMDYSTPYGTNFWHVRNSSSWADMYYAGTNGNLTLTVNALSNPSSVNAAANGSTQIDLSWTKWEGRNVMIVRSTDNTFTAPTPGQGYSVSGTIGGDTVVYNGSGTSFSDTGLSAGNTYYYRLYSENWSYYSSGASTNATLASSPTITVSAGSIGFGSLVNGSTSSASNYTVSGLNLTANITVTPPSGFEVSTSSGSGYGSSLVLTQSAGTVNSTTIYVRFVPSGASSFSGNITHTSTDASTQNKAVSGTGLARPAGKNPTTANATTAYVGDTVQLNINAWQTWNSNNRSYATVFGRYDNANLTSSTTQGTGRDPGASADAMYANAPKFTQAGTFYWAMRVSYGPGNDFYFDASRADWSDLANSLPSSATLSITVSALSDPTSASATANGQTQIDLTWSRWNSREVMVVRSTDASFTAPSGGTSYSVSDTIGGDTVVYRGAATSFSDTGLTPGSTYYYKLYSENYSYYSAGASTDATTDAPASPTITVASGTLAFGSKPITSTSSAQSYTVAGSSLSGNITVTAPSGYEVSVSSGSGYGSSLVLTQSAGSVDSTTIYARFIPSAAQSYNGNISHASSGATTTNKAVTGTGLALPGGKNHTTAFATTALVGDLVTLNINAWQTWNGNNRSYATVFGRYGNANLTSGTVQGAGRDPGAAADAMYADAPRFTQAGTFYWAMRVSYGSGNDFWFDASRADWSDLAVSAPSSASLSITVSALEDPTSITAALDGSSPSSQINLNWSKWNSRDVLIVRSTDDTFTAPTAGQAYSAGNAIGSDTVVYKGSGTSFNDTGLSASSVYYYRLYSENWNYYSTGTTTGSLTTTGSPPPTPTIQGPSAVATDSFRANWSVSAGAASYRLDVSSSSDFSSNLVGYNNLTVNGTYQTVSGLTPGSTYYYRVRAYNANGTSSSSASTNATTAATVTILPASASTTSATYNVTSGSQYTEYYSDDGGDTWQESTTFTASGSTAQISLNEGASSNRIFVMKPSGVSPSVADVDGAQAVITPTITPGVGALTLMSAPYESDRDLGGDLGAQLADGLSTGSEILVMSSGNSPSWSIFALQANGTWSRTQGSASSVLDPGQAFYLRNNGSESEIRFTGTVDTSADKTATLSQGFNLISVSEGKSVNASSAFESASPTGAPNGDFNQADQVVIQNADGSWRRLMRRADGTWYDTANPTAGNTTLQLAPGQGYYYIRRASGTQSLTY